MGPPRAPADPVHEGGLRIRERGFNPWSGAIQQFGATPVFRCFHPRAFSCFPPEHPGSHARVISGRGSRRDAGRRVGRSIWGFWRRRSTGEGVEIVRVDEAGASDSGETREVGRSIPGGCRVRLARWDARSGGCPARLARWDARSGGSPETQQHRRCRGARSRGGCYRRRHPWRPHRWDSFSPFAIRHSPFAIRHSPFAVRYCQVVAIFRQSPLVTKPLRRTLPPHVAQG